MTVKRKCCVMDAESKKKKYECECVTSIYTHKKTTYTLFFLIYRLKMVESEIQSCEEAIEQVTDILEMMRTDRNEITERRIRVGTLRQPPSSTRTTPP